MNPIDALELGLLALMGLAAFTAIVAGIVTARRKIRKEIGLWKIHRRYHPPPAEKTLHF